MQKIIDKLESLQKDQWKVCQFDEAVAVMEEYNIRRQTSELRTGAECNARGNTTTF